MECPVCLEIFSTELKPLILPCGHTLCSYCISDFSARGNIECPTCRVPHGNLNPNSLVINFALIQQDQSRMSSVSWDQIQKLHSQVNQIRQIRDQLQEEYIKVNENTEIISKMASEKYQILKRSLKSLKLKWDNQIKQIQTSNNKIYENAIKKINGVEQKRNNLLEQSKIALNQSSTLSINSRLMLSNLGEIPSIQAPFKSLIFTQDPEPIIQALTQIKGQIKQVPHLFQNPFQKPLEKNLIYQQNSQIIQNPPNNPQHAPTWGFKRPYGKKIIPMDPFFSNSITQALQNQAPNLTLRKPGTCHFFNIDLQNMTFTKINKRGKQGKIHQIVQNSQQKHFHKPDLIPNLLRSFIKR